ncbi:MAG TPA: hydrolase 1, exosortase A system-associated [Crenotrichaceae bacterium]|nr:hydrolase 1, exosortase A system-associated [Crenotrichaceae bacterium]
MSETPVVFECEGHALYGIVHLPHPAKPCGVMIVVGGPQYRVGSHRQFILLARELVNHGFPVMRFDSTGMGDSEGEQTTFDSLDADLRVAINAFYQQQPDLESVVIWGLCDAASAALFYAYQDPRVAGLVLLNPWVYTFQGAAKTYLKHYYLQRLLSRELWIKIISGKFNLVDSSRSLLSMVQDIIVSRYKSKSDTRVSVEPRLVSSELPLPERMKQCWQRFQRPVLCILSGQDLTASEFKELVESDADWQHLLNQAQVTRHDFDASDHTFSRAIWRDQVAEWTLEWLNRLDKPINNTD